MGIDDEKNAAAAAAADLVDEIEAAKDGDVDEEQEEEDKGLSVPELLDEAKRNFALRRWDVAVDAYGQLLESLYGHALLEHAIATSGALGGGGGGKDAPMPSRQGAGASGSGSSGGGDGAAATTVAAARAQDSSASSSTSAALPAVQPKQAAKAHDPRFTFGGDAEESDEEERGNVQPQQEGDDEDDEDDLSVAFSVLELARVRYEKVLETANPSLTTIDGETWHATTIKGQLAEVLNDLADVGLESENFQQASSDYKLSLELLEPLLQPHSRRLADAYLRLGLALEFHPDSDMQASAEKYVTAALAALQKRLAALEARQRTMRDGDETLIRAQNAAADLRTEKAHVESEERLQEQGVLPAANGAAEGDGAGAHLEKDDVAHMDWQAMAKEMRDIAEMTKELELKLDEYKAAAPGAGGSSSSTAAAAAAAAAAGDTKAALQQAINEALLGASTNGIAGDGSEEAGSAFSATKPGTAVNDLSAMVKKKKRPASEQEQEQEEPIEGKGKGKDVDKRVRVEEEGA